MHISKALAGVDAIMTYAQQMPMHCAHTVIDLCESICHNARMLFSSQELPTLDLALLEFPSDKVRLGEMRRHEPRLFTRDSLPATQAADLEACDAWLTELALAEKAFDRACGNSHGRYASDSRSRMVNQLDTFYRKYGISMGQRETQELIRRLESQAREQAPRSAAADRKI